MNLPDIVFSTPAHITGKSAWVEHIPFAFFLIEKLKPAVFVELGSQYGDSYGAFCQAIQTLGTGTRAYAVDTFLGDAHAGFYSRDAYHHLKKINDLHYSHFSNLLCMTFDEASQLFEEQSIDLLHIDGLHTYESVKHDFEVWLPRMSEKGVIILHDTMVRQDGFGVWQLFEEQKDIYPWFEFRHGFGLGVLCTGKSIDGEFINFLKKADNEPVIPELFRQTSLKNEAERQVKQLRDRISGFTNELELTRQHLRKLESEKQQIHQESDEQIRRIESLNLENENLRGKIRSLDVQLAGMTPNHEAETIREHLRQSENEISKLERALYIRKKQITEMSASLSWRLTNPLRKLRQVLRNPEKLEDKEIRALRRSDFFDEQYYIANNPDISSANFDPCIHYLFHGGFEGRDPSPYFESTFYLQRYPDVKEAGINPLIHYIKFGRAEGRLPRAERPAAAQVNIAEPDDKEMILRSGMFDEPYYLSNNRDLQNSDIDTIEHFCEYGWKEDRCPSGVFDTRFYLNAYPDVKEAGINPLLHYILYGKSEGRKTNIFPKLVNSDRPPATVLFISGEWKTPGHYYRVKNYMDAFLALGIEANWTVAELLIHQINLLDHCKLLFVWRTRISPAISQVISKAKEKGTVVVFDIDDLLFDPSLAEPEIIDAIRSIHGSKKPVQEYCEGMLATALLSDCCTGSTLEIAETFRRLGKPGIILPNGYSRETFEKSARLIDNINHHPGVIRMGYAGGTLTHQHDFALVFPAIARILDEFPHIVLTVFSESLHMHEFPELSHFKERIEVRNMVPFPELQEEIYRFDINLAPLEDNPFCRAKSELKFFEAALLKIPTIASPTPPFQRIITHGKSGFLAKTSEDWYQALRLLVTDKETREQTGRNAHAVVRWRFGPEERVEKTASFLHFLKNQFSLDMEPYAKRNLFSPAAETVNEPDRLQLFSFPILPGRHFLMETRTHKSSDVGILLLAGDDHSILISTLDSISRQTLAGIDVMIVPEFVDEMALESLANWQVLNRERFNRIVVMQRKTGDNLSTLLNTGLAELYTTFFMAISPGTHLFPEMLEKSVAVMEESNAVAGLGRAIPTETPVVILRSAYVMKNGGFDAGSGTLNEALDAMTGKFHRHGQYVLQMPGYSGFTEYPSPLLESSELAAKEGAKTILFVGHDDAKAGAQVVMLQLMKWIKAQKDFNMVLLLLRCKNILLNEYQQLARVICHDDYRKAFSDPFVRRAALSNRIGKIDLIYGNTILSSLLYEDLVQFGAPVISHIHEMDKVIRVLLDDREIRELHRKTHYYISCSPAVTKNLLEGHRIDRRKLTTIEAFITPPAPGAIRSKSEVRTTMQWEQDTFIVLGCGTINYRKGVDLFIETAERLLQTGFTTFHFYWIGENQWDMDTHVYHIPHWDHYAAEIERKGLQDKITFTGPVDSIFDYLPGADLFYLPSREDPFPLVCLEASFAGIPVLCFKDSGDIPDAFGADAIFSVNMEDTRAAALQIERLANEPEIARKYGENARNIVTKKYLSHSAAPKILDVCRNVMKAGSSHSTDPDPFSMEKNPFRWVFVTTNDGSPDGGSEKLWIQSALRCRETGDEVSIVIKKWEPEPIFLGTLFSRGIRVIFKDQDPYTAVLHERPDIVVISTGDQNEGVDWFEFCRTFAIPYVIVNHLTKAPEVWPVNGRLKSALSKGYLSARKVMFTGRNNLRLMERRLDTMIPGAAVFFNPTDLERFPSVPFPDDQQGIQIAMVGTLLHIHKGSSRLPRQRRRRGEPLTPLIVRAS